MARQIEEFVVAWDALSGKELGEGGWRGIPVSPVGPCTLVAARRFPGNEETLLAQFPSSKLAPSERLPDGKGFEVLKVDPYRDGKTWIALSRRESGSPELFAEMVGDVAGAMDAKACESEDGILRAMLRRIRMWQEFMGKGARPLGPEAELGLVGELSFLKFLIDSNISAEMALDAWLGPDDAPQDFVIGSGAVEVKATVAASGFPAKIGSLEQLDDGTLSPLYLAAVKFSVIESGKTLPEMVADVEDQICDEPGATAFFREKLFSAGYHESHAPRYVRRFSEVETRLLTVVEGFPRLTRASVPNGIANAVYEIDISRLSGFDVDVVSVLTKLGVKQ